MVISREAFAEFSAEVTGYTAFELEGTGLIDTHHKLLEEILGPHLTGELGRLITDILCYPPASAEREKAIRDSLQATSIFWPVVSSLISLWYMGMWTQLPEAWYATAGLPLPGPRDVGRTHTPSALAYVAQLSYRTAHAHTPGANPTGFASWAFPPIGSAAAEVSSRIPLAPNHTPNPTTTPTYK